MEIFSCHKTVHYLLVPFFFFLAKHFHIPTFILHVSSVSASSALFLECLILYKHQTEIMLGQRKAFQQWQLFPNLVTTFPQPQYFGKAPG